MKDKFCDFLSASLDGEAFIRGQLIKERIYFWGENLFHKNSTSVETNLHPLKVYSLIIHST